MRTSGDKRCIGRPACVPRVSALTTGGKHGAPAPPATAVPRSPSPNPMIRILLCSRWTMGGSELNRYKRYFLQWSRMSVGVGIALMLMLMPLPVAVGQQAEKLLSEEFREIVPLLSSVPMFLAAQSLNITVVAGKDLTVGGSPPGNANSRRLQDVGIGVTALHENEPTIVANPRDNKNLVAGNHVFPVGPRIRCAAYVSNDAGRSFSFVQYMPQLTAASDCSDPVLAYAPDGSRVYYAYMDIKPGDFDIVVSYSNDGGATWTGPVIALNALPGFLYDKPWIGTHVEGSANYVYVTATRFGPGATRAIDFTRSSNQGTAWSGPLTLDATAAPLLVQGSRPTGGPGGSVLVAWYYSGPDGWLVGSFQIRTRYSADNGATWGPVVTSVIDATELPFWLGPFAFYHRWWGAMFPDVEITPGGSAHIAYTHDPVAGTTTAEDGDIRYITSAAPPYGQGSWSAPVTVNDDGLVRAQGYVALETQHGGQSSSLHAVWEDHRLSPTVPLPALPNSSNLFYDQFYSRKVPGHGWFSNFRVSDTSSISDFFFIGDYIDLAANDTNRFAIWTDRRHQTSIFAPEDNTFGSRIISGGAAP